MHGSDLNLDAEGKDPFEAVKKLGKFRVIPRLDSISTTEIIQRLLRATSEDRREQRRTEEEEDADSYLLTTDRLCQFMNTSRHRAHVPKEGQRVVYVGGSWDLFHSGHVRILQEAKKLGDYLIVGIHEDSTVTGHAGAGHPIMNLFERSMNVLGIRDVDEIVFDAPYFVTRAMVHFLKIDVILDASINIDYAHEKGVDLLQELRAPKSNKLLSKMSKLLHSATSSDRPDAQIVRVELPDKDVLTSMELHQRINAGRDAYMKKVGKPTDEEAAKLQEEKRASA